MGLFDRFRREPVARVRMVLSVGEFPAGEQFDVPVPVADQWIARGYAEGNLSREFTSEELAELRANVQVVKL
jgi:hypothetical protein